MEQKTFVNILESVDLKYEKSKLILRALKDEVAKGNDDIEITYHANDNNHNFVFNYKTVPLASFSLLNSMEFIATPLIGLDNLPKDLVVEIEKALEEVKNVLQPYLCKNDN